MKSTRWSLGRDHEGRYWSTAAQNYVAGTKAQAILDYLAAHPDTTPTEVVAAMPKHFPTTRAYVRRIQSTIKT